MTVRIRVLGPIGLDVDGSTRPVGGPAQRGVLARLAASPGRVVGLAELAEAAWCEDLPADVGHALQSHMSRIRGALRPAQDALIERRGAGYRLVAPAIESDASLAQDLLVRAQAVSGDPGEAKRLALEGLDLWAGTPYEDVPPSAFVEAEQVRLEEVRLRLHEVHAAAVIDGSDPADVVPELLRLTQEHPLRERFWVLRARALAAAGRRNEALAALGELRQMVRDELGVDPGADARALHARLLDEDAQGAGPGDDRVPSRLPAPPAVLPASLDAARRAGPCVAREDALGELQELLDGATHLQLVLVAGEAGIGKTRLSAELAQAAVERGMAVRHGGCTPAGGPYEPLIDALADATPGRAVTDATPLEELGLAGLADGALSLGDDPTRWRRLVARMVAERLGGLADAGLLVVLDDLHWGTSATLDVLRELVRRPPPGRMLVVGTFRDTELTDDHPLTARLGDLRRLGAAKQLRLEGLPVEAVADLAAQRGLDPDACHDLAARVVALTGGNAFFATALLDHPDVLRGPGSLPVPDEVRDVVASRIVALPATAREVLDVAALFRDEADVGVLAAAMQRPVDEVIAALERAEGARLLRETRIGGFRFVHEIVRAAVLDGQSLTRRSRRHLALADALDRFRAPPADLAHHLVRAGGQPQVAMRAVRACLAAGDRALDAMAPDEAADHFGEAQRVAGALAVDGVDALRRRAMLGLGRAQRDAGDPGFRRTLLDAAEAAWAAEDDEVLTAAALANHRGMWSALAVVDDERLVTLDRAVGRTTEPTVRARLLARTAIESMFAPDRDTRELLDEAQHLLEHHEDAATTAEVLFARVTATWQLDRAEHLHQESARLVQVLESLGDPIASARALLNHNHNLRTVGRTDDARDALRAAASLAEEFEDDTLRMYVAAYRAAQGLLEGHPDEATKAAEAVLALGGRTGQPDAADWYLSIQVAASILAGRQDEVLAMMAAAPEGLPPTVQDLEPVRAMSGLAMARAGDHAAGVRRWHEVADGLRERRHDFLWIQTVVALASGASEVGDAGRSREIIAQASPYAEQIVNGGIVMWPCTHHSLGMLAAAAGDRRMAEEHFASAEQREAAAGAEGWLVHTRLERAANLRALDPDSRQATELLEAAVEGARRLGLTALVQQARQRRDRLG